MHFQVGPAIRHVPTMAFTAVQDPRVASGVGLVRISKHDMPRREFAWSVSNLSVCQTYTYLYYLIIMQVICRMHGHKGC